MLSIRLGGRPCWMLLFLRKPLLWKGAEAAANVTCRNYNSTAPLSDMVELQEDMTDKFIPPLKALAPDSGVYLNEVRVHTAAILWLSSIDILN